MQEFPEQPRQRMVQRGERPGDPFVRFAAWLAEAAGTEPNDPNAMALTTLGQDGFPAARIVLLQRADARGFVFYGSQRSRKTAELAENPRATLLVHWKTQRRQVRVTGQVTLVPAAELDAFFAAWPRRAQLGARIAEQPRPLADAAAHEARLAELAARWPGTVPRPAHWRGWCLVPESIEFWQTLAFHQHERLIYRRDADAWRAIRSRNATSQA